MNANSERVEVAACDTFRADRADGDHPSIHQQSERDDDTDGVDPARDMERNGGFDLAGPSREGEEVHGSEGIDAIHGQGDEEEEPKEKVGEGR